MGTQVFLFLGKACLIFCLEAAVGAAEHPVPLSERVTLSASEPVVVAFSQPGESRWGYHQFPEFNRYPDGRLLVRFHATADAVKAYGDAKPTYASLDAGATWQALKDPSIPKIGMICEVFGGEYLCSGSTPPLDLRKDKLSLPQPVAAFNAYVDNHYFKAQDCPPQVQEYLSRIPVHRWTPRTRTWTEESMRYDLRNALAWTRAKGEESNMVARSFLEYAPVRMGKELLYADYRQNYLGTDGAVPKSRSVSLMLSNDNGRSWSCCSTVYVDPKGEYLSAEPMLEIASNGELICVIRRTDQRQKSMLITFSKDQGRTWEKPTDLIALGDFGVWPRLQRMENGVLVLSYGRPGAWLAFSLDGTGRTWSKPVPVIAGDPQKKQFHSCGYTNLHALDANSFLLAYSDFQYPNPQAKTCKAILVRKYKLTIRK